MLVRRGRALVNKTVLLVDGSLSSLEYLELIVRRIGYETRIAKDGEACLQAIRIAPPDLVMSETRLPDGEGLALCRRIKKYPATSLAHVVFVTTDESEGTRKAAFEQGCSEYLTKPVKSRTVFKVLEDTIGNRRRKKMRIVYTLTVQVGAPGGESRQLETASFGEGGMFLETDSPTPVGTALDLGFELPGVLKPFCLRGQVIYTFGPKAEAFTPGMGIRFVDVPWQTQALLSGYVEEYVSGRLRVQTPVGEPALEAALR